MALVKPSWLHNWLLRFNYEIFGTRVPVGDILENVADFIISQIDVALVQSVRAYDKAVEVGDRLETTEQHLTNELMREIERVVDLVGLAFPGIYEIWESLKSRVTELVAGYAQETLDLVRQVDQAQDGIEVLLERIRQDYALRSWVLDAIKASQRTTEDRLAEVTARIAAEEERTEHWWDTLGRFFNDPWGFMVEEFLKWLVGNLDTIFEAFETALWGRA